MKKEYRIPAEWEPQGAVLLAWPHASTDWAEQLIATRHIFDCLIRTISIAVPVILLAPADEHGALVRRFRNTRYPVYVQAAHYNDTWLRDSIFLSTLVQTPANDSPGWLALDFTFTGWGGKFDASLDNRLNRALLEQWQLLDHWQPRDFELEGGAVDFDGHGSVLTTVACLQKRHPLPLEQLTLKLQKELNVQRVLWLHHGAIEGDDTDSHVDMLARFAGADQLIYQSCDETEYTHYLSLQAMAEELRALRQADGKPYRLHALPWPDPVFDDATGRRLPASYANFLISNGHVFVPFYDCPQDSQAAAVIQQAFPAHRVLGIPCRALIWQNGSLHCSTMQLPHRVFADIQPGLKHA